MYMYICIYSLYIHIHNMSMYICLGALGSEDADGPSLKHSSSLVENGKFPVSRTWKITPTDLPKVYGM